MNEPRTFNKLAILSSMSEGPWEGIGLACLLHHPTDLASLAALIAALLLLAAIVSLPLQLKQLKQYNSHGGAASPPSVRVCGQSVIIRHTFKFEFSLTWSDIVPHHQWAKAERAERVCGRVRGDCQTGFCCGGRIFPACRGRCDTSLQDTSSFPTHTHGRKRIKPPTLLTHL